MRSNIWLQWLAGRLGPLIEENFPLGANTTYRVGGVATVALRVQSLDQLQLVASALRSLDEPPDIVVLGNGSNMLVADEGFDGVVVALSGEFASLRVEEGQAVLGGQLSLPVAARRLSAQGKTGFEWAVGVPGSIGGAVKMNAGGHGSDMATSLMWADVVDLTGAKGAQEVRKMRSDELEFGYRSSSLGPSEIVVAGAVALGDGDVQSSTKMLAEIVSWRRAHQPGGQNAGSVFVNPSPAHAARLIEECDLTGFRLGSAYVSGKHANFIQVDPGGFANDVYRLIGLVRGRVYDQFGVELATEIKMIGFSNLAEVVDG